MILYTYLNIIENAYKNQCIPKRSNSLVIVCFRHRIEKDKNSLVIVFCPLRIEMISLIVTQPVCIHCTITKLIY